MRMHKLCTAHQIIRMLTLLKTHKQGYLMPSLSQDMSTGHFFKFKVFRFLTICYFFKLLYILMVLKMQQKILVHF